MSSVTIPPGGNILFQSGLSSGKYSVRQQLTLIPKDTDYIVRKETYLQIDDIGTWQLKTYEILYCPPAAPSSIAAQRLLEAMALTPTPTEDETTPTPQEEDGTSATVDEITPTPQDEDGTPEIVDIMTPQE